MKAKAFVIIHGSTNIDIMPLVLCCDCKYYDREDCCTKNGLIVPKSGKWFCADGEKEEDEDAESV